MVLALLWVGDLAVLILGIVGIVRARFSLAKGRVVEGGPARLVGALLSAGGLLAFLSGFVLAWVIKLQKEGGGQFTPDEVIRIETMMICLNAGIVVAFLVGGLVLARKNAQEPINAPASVR
jgi:hypothetical protein